MIGRLTASRDELEAAEARDGALGAGGTPISTCADRELVTLAGTLRTVTFRPRSGVPALEAELYDGSGTVALVWLGRRRIAGVEPGRAMRVQGRIACGEGRPVIFNPRYELRPAHGNA
ncbi:MAG: OB-fold nucleic acid binding domain-containing protein [Sporichthyaceae bacterium]